MTASSIEILVTFPADDWWYPPTPVTVGPERHPHLLPRNRLRLPPKRRPSGDADMQRAASAY
jgi:hypothetical protein